MKTIQALIVALYDQNPMIDDVNAALIIAGQTGITYQEALSAVEAFNV